MEQQDFERIARTALRELGSGNVPITITPDGQQGTWHITIAGGQAPLKIRCGRGTTPQWIREQIFDQFNAR